MRRRGGGACRRSGRVVRLSGHEKVSSVSKRRLRLAAPPAVLPPLTIQRHSSGSALRRSPATQRPSRSKRPCRPSAVGDQDRAVVVGRPLVDRAAERVL